MWVLLQSFKCAYIHPSAHASTLCICVCTSYSHTAFNRRWAPTSPWQISTCVWDQCCCTCGSSPWSHSLCTITHHLRPCLNDWLTDGRISPDKKLKWLITRAHLSTWGGPAVPKTAGLKRVHLSWVCPPDTLEQIPQHMDLHGHHHSYVYVCKLPLTVSYQPKTYTVHPGDRKIN